MIRFRRCGIARVDDNRVLEAAIVPIFPLRRIGAAGSDQAVDDAEVFKDFLAARLDTLAARAAKRGVHLFDQPEGDVSARQINRQRQTSRAGSANQNLCGSFFPS